MCDLPATRSDVTAHRAEIKVCPACGKLSKGTFPAAVTQAVHYGPTVHTWASYFTHDHHIPVERTTESFADLVQHRMSEATVLKASEHLDTCIAPSTEAVKGLLRAAAVLHVDESGLRVRGGVTLAACRLHRASDVVGGPCQARPRGDGGGGHSWPVPWDGRP